MPKPEQQKPWFDGLSNEEIYRAIREGRAPGSAQLGGVIEVPRTYLDWLGRYVSDPDKEVQETVTISSHQVNYGFGARFRYDAQVKVGDEIVKGTDDSPKGAISAVLDKLKCIELVRRLNPGITITSQPREQDPPPQFVEKDEYARDRQAAMGDFAELRKRIVRLEEAKPKQSAPDRQIKQPAVYTFWESDGPISEYRFRVTSDGRTWYQFDDPLHTGDWSEGAMSSGATAAFVKYVTSAMTRKV